MTHHASRAGPGGSLVGWLVGAGMGTPLFGVARSPPSLSAASAGSPSEGVEEGGPDAVADDEGDGAVADDKGEGEASKSPFRGALPRVSDVMPSPEVRRELTTVCLRDRTDRRCRARAQRAKDEPAGGRVPRAMSSSKLMRQSASSGTVPMICFRNSHGCCRTMIFVLRKIFCAGSAEHTHTGSGRLHLMQTARTIRESVVLFPAPTNLLLARSGILCLSKVDSSQEEGGQVQKSTISVPAGEDRNLHWNPEFYWYVNF